jgi:hypothetical protein
VENVVTNNNVLGAGLKFLGAEKVFKPIPDKKLFNPTKAFTTPKRKKKRRSYAPNILSSRIWDATADKKEQKIINNINNILGL